MRMGRLTALSGAELKQIDAASIRILSEVGVQINSDYVLDILAGAGAEIDREKRIVRFSEEMTRQALATVPCEVKLYSRALKDCVVLGEGRMAVASGHNAVFIIDSKTGRRRTVTKDDISKFAVLTDALDDMDILGIQAMPQDVKEEATLLHAYQVSVTNSSKHIYFSPESVDVVKAILQMAKIVCGSDDLSTASPVTCQLSPTSPLMWEPGAVEGVVECAKAGVPLAFYLSPLAG